MRFEGYGIHPVHKGRIQASAKQAAGKPAIGATQVKHLFMHAALVSRLVGDLLVSGASCKITFRP